MPLVLSTPEMTFQQDSAFMAAACSNQWSLPPAEAEFTESPNGMPLVEFTSMHLQTRSQDTAIREKEKCAAAHSATFPELPPGVFFVPPEAHQQEGYAVAPVGVFNTESVAHENSEVSTASDGVGTPEPFGSVPGSDLAALSQSEAAFHQSSGVVFVQQPILLVPFPDGTFLPVQVSQWEQMGSPEHKNFADALRPDESAELKRAVHDSMAAQLQRGWSSPLSCSTGEGLSDFDGTSSCKTPPEAAGLDKPMHCRQQDGGSEFAQDINDAFVNLESTADDKQQRTLEWVSELFWQLALRKKGCHLVQKAMEVGSSEYQLQLLENLRGHTLQAAQSPHANYVLQKFIKIVPPDQLQFIVDELKECALTVARHRFACRILERLLEFCAPWQTEKLVDEIVSDAAKLCKDTFGNFILQQILQHGTPQHRSAIAKVLLADINRLAKHRTASHIVSCALVHCSPEDIECLTHALREDAGQLCELSRKEYGSFVAREAKRAAQLLKAREEEDGIQRALPQ